MRDADSAGVDLTEVVCTLPAAAGRKAPKPMRRAIVTAIPRRVVLLLITCPSTPGGLTSTASCKDQGSKSSVFLAMAFGSSGVSGFLLERR
jgi:hypothetical protein